MVTLHGAALHGARVGIETGLGVGLSRDAEDPFPGSAEGVHDSRRGSNQPGDGNQHHTVVHQTHGEGGVAGHGPVHSVLREYHAVHAVTRVGRDGSMYDDTNDTKIR